MLKEEKIVYYKEFKKELKGHDMIVFDYRGINVLDLTEMRKKVREQGGSLKIVKNSLLKKYAKEEGIKFEDDIYSGMNAIVSMQDDFTSIGKILSDVEKNEKIKIRAGLYEQKEIDAEYVKKLANIPSKTELYSMLVGGLQGVISNLVYTLESVADKKQKEGE